MANSSSPVSEDTARNLLSALERVLDVLPVTTPHSTPARPPASTTTSTSAAVPSSSRRTPPVTMVTTARPISNPRGQSSGRSVRHGTVIQEHSRLFGYTPSVQPPNKKKCKMFSRNIVCLSGCESEEVPSKEEKLMLKANGLGEVSIDFETDGDAQHVQDKILSTFSKPELENGFELMVTKTNSRSKLDVVHSGACVAKDLKLFSTHRIYIRPIQQDVPIVCERSHPSSETLLRCYVCETECPTSEIRAHVEQCKIANQRESQMDPAAEASSSQIDEEPVVEQTTGSDDYATESQQLIDILKEGYSEGSEVKSVVEAFRQLFLQGRSLNLPGGVDDYDFTEGDTYEVIISRYDVFGGMTDEFTASSYNPRLPLKVEFMGEKGQDLGGPRKEFLRLALKEIVEKLTTGPENSRTLVVQHNYVERKAYFTAGIIIGQCILQDGPTPRFLSSALVERLLNGETSNSSESQLADGLTKTGVINLIKAFPQCKSLLHDDNPPAPLTARKVISSFEPRFSESGTNVRMHEEVIMGHFVRYLREIEAGQHRVNSSSDGELIELRHIFKFVTGLEAEPVCGWQPSLVVTFVQQDTDVMGVGACTCSHQLQLPVPSNVLDQTPARDVIFDLFNNSFPDEFFGKA